MKKHIVNIAWAIIVSPFYLLLLICCIYSRFIQFVFNEDGEKIEAYNWIDRLDFWGFKQKEKWLVMENQEA